MEIKTLFPNLSAMWVRWSDYEIKDVSGVAYLMPTPSAAEIPYSYAEQTTELVTDGLNLGKLVYSDEDTAAACLGFARKYGLPGIAKPDERQGMFARGALSPMRKDPASREYGEELGHFCAVFLGLYLHFLSVRGELPQQQNDYHSRPLAELTAHPIPAGMGYCLTAGAPPQLVWQPDSLQSILRLAYGLAITDPAQPLKVCKNCGTIYHNPHQKSEFCSVKCRNYYNVQVFRGKRGEKEE